MTSVSPVLVLALAMALDGGMAGLSAAVPGTGTRYSPARWQLRRGVSRPLLPLRRRRGRTPLVRLGHVRLRSLAESQDALLGRDRRVRQEIEAVRQDKVWRL